MKKINEFFILIKSKNFYTINKGISKRLLYYFSYQSMKVLCNSKISKIAKNSNSKPLSIKQIDEIREYYSSFGFKNINTKWHKVYTHLSGEFHKEYIPEDLFYNVIIPNLNMTKMQIALTDKNLLDKLFYGTKQPDTIIKNINGIYYENKKNEIIEIKEVLNECNKCSSLIIKPSVDSGGGKDVIVFNLKNGKTDYKNLTIHDLIKLYDKDFIIQKLIKQHKQMSLLNSSSVNTLRFVTLLINGGIEILATNIRIGGRESRVDNASQGGIWCKIKKNGCLSEKGFSKSLNFVLETDSKIKLKDFKIPNYVKAIEEVKRLHVQIPHFRFIAWDLAVDSSGEIVLIEYNVRAPGIDSQVTGKPIFNKFTNEILSQCELNLFSS